MERLTHFFEGEYRMNYGVGIHEAVQRLGSLEDENAALIKELEQIYFGDHEFVTIPCDIDTVRTIERR